MSRPARFQFHPSGVVVLSVLSALALMLALDPIANMAQSPFLLFFGAVVVSAWWGGTRAGLATAILAALISNYFFIEPKYTFTLSLGNFIRTFAFILECILISVLCGSLRTTNRRLDASLAKLKIGERSLQQAHQNITELLDAVTDGFYTLNQNWEFTYINQQAAQNLNHSRESLLGQSIWQVFPDARGTLFEETCHRAIAEQTSFVFETSDRINPNLWSEVHVNPLHNGLAIYVQEVTDRKQAELALSQSETRFRQIFECNMVAMGIWSSNGGIIQANDRLLDLIGYTRQELEAGQINWQTLTPPEWLLLDKQILEKLSIQGPMPPYEKEYIHKKGHRIPILIGGASFENDPENGIFFAIDLTEQKRAETLRMRLSEEQERLLQALAAERAQFEAVLQQMPEGVMIADAESGNLVLANEQANRILQHSYPMNMELEQYTPRVPFEAFHADGHRYMAEEYPLLRSLRTGEVIRHEEMKICHEDGSCIFIDTNSAPIRNSQGDVISAVVVFQDITQRKQTENALRQSEERLQVALKNAPIAVFSQDQDLRYTWIENPTHDYQTNQVIGKKDSDLVSVEEAAVLTKIKQQVLNTGIGTREEVKLTQQNQDQYYDLTVEPLRNASNDIIGITCAAIDISELKRTELALRESEARFRLLAERVHIIPWESDPATGQFTYVGPQAAEILGYPLEDWYCDRIWTEHIYYADRDWVPKFFRETATLLDNYDFEYRMLAADGRVIWIYAVVNVVRNAKGPKLLRGIMIDITRRKRQEEAQQYLANISQVLASSLDYQTTLNQLAQHMVPHLADWCTVHLVEQDGTIRDVATAHVDPEKVKWAIALRQQYPLDPDDIRGTPKVLRTGQSEFYPNIPDDLLVQSARDPEHLRLLREVGFSAAMIVPMQAHGKILGALSLISAESGRTYDQADLALAEELARHAALAVDNAQLYKKAQQEQAKAEAANRIKDEFLAVLSHELRTPLNPILGWSNLLRSGRLDATKTAYALETIERNAKLQTQLIEDLLDVSRILQGKLTLNMAPVNLVTTIEAALETVKLAAEAKSIEVTSYLSAPEQDAAPFTSLPLMVLGDSARLQQIVWNLLTNAVKFTPTNGKIEVTLVRLDSQAQIQVSDTGKGISSDFLPYVFDYFRQADSATTRKFGGLGLGLAIVRHLVELHGGIIYVDSPGEGQGATFNVRLPLLRAKSLGVTGESPVARGVAAKFPLEAIRILLVDDDVDTRHLMAFTLTQAGATVTEVASAKDALRTLEQTNFDVLVSDIGMPEMDGYALMRQVRARPQGGTMPAIALTAYAGESNQQQAVAAGFQTHVSKPIEPADLVAIVAHLIEPTGGNIDG